MTYREHINAALFALYTNPWCSNHQDNKLAGAFYAWRTIAYVEAGTIIVPFQTGNVTLQWPQIW